MSDFDFGDDFNFDDPPADKKKDKKNDSMDFGDDFNFDDSPKPKPAKSKS